MNNLSSNAKLELILKEKNLYETRVVRYVYLLSNEKNELLFVHKEANFGRVSGTFYLGWQLHSECYWGVDLWDLDILEIAAECIREDTNLSISAADIQLIDVFQGSQKEEGILNIAYYAKFDDTTAFNFWYDWDDEIKWLPLDQALKFATFDADKRLLQRLQNGVVDLLNEKRSFVPL